MEFSIHGNEDNLSVNSANLMNQPERIWCPLATWEVTWFIPFDSSLFSLNPVKSFRENSINEWFCHNIWKLFLWSNRFTTNDFRQKWWHLYLFLKKGTLHPQTAGWILENYEENSVKITNCKQFFFLTSKNDNLLQTICNSTNVNIEKTTEQLHIQPRMNIVNKSSVLDSLCNNIYWEKIVPYGKVYLDISTKVAN